MDNSEKYWITHLRKDEFEQEGLKKLFFYTQKEVGSEDFYFGKGNNPFSKKTIEELVIKGQLIPLPQPVKLEEKKGLWINSKMEVFYADLIKPNSNKEYLFLIN